MNTIKSYQEFINESVSLNNISYEEARKDIETVRDAFTKAEKVAVASKYGIDSVKSGEIASQIKLLMNDVHKSKSSKEYTDEDFEWWWGCFDAPTSPAALKKALAGEKLEWHDFVLNKANELIFKNKRGDYWTKAQKSFEKYITDLLNKDKNSKDTNRINLISTLIEETKDFHDAYINHIRKWAVQKFSTNIQMKDFKIEDYMSIFGTQDRSAVIDRAKGEKNVLRGVDKYDFVKYFSPISEEYICPVKSVTIFSSKYTAAVVRKPIFGSNKMYINGTYKITDETAVSDVPNAEALRRMKSVREFGIRSKWNKDNYVTSCVDDGEKKFKQDIETIADKVRRMNMEEENLKLLSIEDDVKHFDVVITDGKKTVHARSIFAAEFSELVTPHYRFIIT